MIRSTSTMAASSSENIRKTVHGLKPVLVMILAQTLLTTVNVGYKLASNDGMSLSVLVAYRLIFGAAVMIPIAAFAERGKRPKLTATIVLYGFLCGLFGGALGQIMYLQSLVMISATFASAMINLVPAITFVIAASLRLEKLGWNTSSGRAKLLGTFLGICGAMVFTFYKGPELHIGNTGINLLETTSSHPIGAAHTAHPSGHRLVLGLILGLASCVCYSLWLIIQAKAAEKYPCPYSLTAMMNVWGSIQSSAYAMGTERDWSQWALGWNIRLLAVLVSGVLGSGLMFTLVAWCVRMRGPLFVSVFNPLMLVMVAIAGALFLEEKLRLGMLFGCVLIVVGLYMVLWGKGKELNKTRQIIPESVVEMNTTQEAAELPSTSVNRGGSSSRRKETGEEEEDEHERRDSQASTEILGGLYMYP